MRNTPLLGPTITSSVRAARRNLFPGSLNYWEHRYSSGGDSGAGSQDALARFKAEVLNSFIAENDVTSVIEFGCGDGRQLELAEYPRYLGLDVSPTGLDLAHARFSDDRTKSFLLYEPRHFFDSAEFIRADLTLSLDVIYHLIEDEIYELHLSHLFAASTRFVALYTSDDSELNAPTGHSAPHVRHRPVTHDVARRFPHWRLRKKTRNRYPYTENAQVATSFADFFIYEHARRTGDQSTH
ncbi:class I SAM-dependent methyltransferase [Streptomyces sp. GC420]|nr:class I SAM-dependent methyltransferase [Streptomyces sp. GC420]